MTERLWHLIDPSHHRSIFGRTIYTKECVTTKILPEKVDIFEMIKCTLFTPKFLIVNIVIRTILEVPNQS